MKKGRLVFLLIFMLGYITLNVQAASPMDLHFDSFNRVTSLAERNNYYKYGIYSSRIITVSNPEVYLQGDLYFAKLITSNPGYEYWYKIGTSPSYIKIKWGSPFSFNLIELDSYNIKQNGEIYNNYPIYDYIDERISSIHTTLKVKDITSLEAANLLYIKKRIEGSPVSDTYLIFTEDKKGYVYSKGSYFNWLGKKVNYDQIYNPILIFNEKSVWYPLMGRDDRKGNPGLNKIVEKISTDKNIPVFDQREGEIIDKLRNVSILETKREREIAALASIHSTIYNASYSNILYNKWHSLFPEINFDTVFMFKSLLFNKIGNYLSPNTAYLASLIDRDINKGINNIEREYIKYVGRERSGVYQGKKYEYKMAYGFTWPIEVIVNNIDDSYRTRGGNCRAQAINLSSVLDVAGVKNIIDRSGYPVENHLESHMIVLIPEIKKKFSNGVLYDYDNTKKDRRIKGVIFNDKFVILTYDCLYANTDYEQAVFMLDSVLNEIKSVYKFNMPQNLINIKF